MMKTLFYTLLIFGGIQLTTFSQSVIITPDGKVEQRAMVNAELNIFGNSAAVIKGSGFRGTLESPEPPIKSYYLFRVDAGGYDGSHFTSQRAGIRFMATENWSTENNGTSIRFLTTENNSTLVGIKMTLNDKGYLGIGNFGNLSIPGIEQKLHVEDGNALFENVNPFLFLRTTGAAGTGNAGITFQNSLKQTKAVINYNHPDDAIRIVNGSSTTDGIYVANGNMVGVGQNTPTGKLHVKSNSQISQPQLLIEEDNSSDYGRINFNNSGSAAYWALAGKTDGAETNARFNIYSSHFGNVATFYGDGNTRLAGYTQLGSSAPKVKLQKLTGTTSGSSTTSIAHGSSIGKVLDARVYVYFNSSLKIPANHSSSVFSYDVQINNSDIDLVNVPANLQNKAYEVVLTIEE